MKLYASLSVGFIAFFSPKVNANGVCYDPDHTSVKNAMTVQEDMKTIANAGFTSVRTYISKFGDTEMGSIITGAGLTAVLGVPYPQSDYLDQMEAAISAANAGGVYAIMVGNENLAGATSVPSDMIDVINQIKSRVSCKVGTVQRNTEVIGFQGISGWSKLVSSVDIIGVNLHPFFHPSTTADGAIDVVDKQWQIMMSNFGDKLLLTETGWPSSGSVLGNTGSIAGEQIFFSAYQTWSSGLSEKFYFQFFDTPGKPEAFEQSYGLYTANSQPKLIASQQPQQMNPSSPPSSASTLPTSAPAPPTAALPPVTAAPAPTEALEPSVDDPKQEDSTINPGTSEISSSPETHQESEPSASNTTSSNPLTPLSISSGNDTYSGNSAISNTPENLSTNLVTKAEFRSIEKTDTELIGSVGKSTETQRTTGSGDNSAQTINNQSEEADSNHGIIGLAVGGGACAMLIAFGVIYQARKRAKGLEYEDKDVHFQAATP